MDHQTQSYTQTILHPIILYDDPSVGLSEEPVLPLGVAGKKVVFPSYQVTFSQKGLTQDSEIIHALLILGLGSNKQTNKLKGNPKFSYTYKTQWVGRGVLTKTQTKNIHTIEPGSQQAHNQSDAQDKHTKHCEQGLYLAETSQCSDRQYLCSENTVQGLVRFSIFGDNLKGLVSSGSECK